MCLSEDSNPLLNLGFEVSASVCGKAGKLELGGAGWEDQGLEFILGTDLLYWILAMCTPPCCLPSPSLLFLGDASVFSCKPYLSYLLGLRGKRDGWHVFLFQCKGKMQVCVLYLLDASQLRKLKMVQENYFLR